MRGPPGRWRASRWARSPAEQGLLVEYDIALHETALDLLGAEGESAHGDWAEGYVFSLAGPVYAGTNEIQRDIIAERLLGLPKGR